jgi:hypothetical protein
MTVGFFWALAVTAEIVRNEVARNTSDNAQGRYRIDAHSL